ncbi:MAG TPA: FecR domain-containing protein [Bacteroidales bacterium]
MDENLHRDYLDEEEFKKLSMEQKVLRYSTTYEVPVTLSKDEALQQLKTKIASGRKAVYSSQTTKTNIIYWVTSAAAFVVLLFGIWNIWIRKPMTEVAVNKGQHSAYQLPDGSLVTLNADSKIFFSKNKFNKYRYLKLDGEAFFNIRKGNTFTISTKLADIRILGTTFNVFSRDSSFKVSCLTGKISVTSGDQSVIVTPGESALIHNGRLEKYEDKNIVSAASWRMGEFNFEDASISSVLSEIGRQFNVTFVVTKMQERYFTGSFTNKNLVSALDIVCIPLGLTYEIGQNSTIYIKEKDK